MDATAPPPPPIGRLQRRTTLHRLLDRSKRMRHSDLERAQPFSWVHCAISVVSYLLMLSDVLRTGLGVRGLTDQYSFHEPDQLVFFGPYAYPVISELLANETSTAESVRYWPYKYDTTSAVMRALAHRFKIQAWSACVLYEEACDEHGGLPARSVFEMLDSVVDAVRAYPGIRPSKLVKQGHISLRMDYAYFDRVHHYAFPWFFFRPNRRTAQAIHYEMRDLEASAICGFRSPRPYACGEAWTNYARLCSRHKTELCDDSHIVWSHITSRMRKLAQKYPNSTIDFVLLEGMDDFWRQSLTFQGMKLYDVVTLARIRQCGRDDPASCVTIAVDDYRYEAATLAVNAPNWYGVSATIRGFGQLYAWLRLIFLLVGCYVARSSETQMMKSGLMGRIFTTIRTVFLVPSQVMIYGSTIPIMCYVAAHLIDSAAVYELMGEQFTSLMGVINLDHKELLRVCAVSMRSVWMLALACHALHWVSAQCVWSPLHGVLGVPEFVVSFVASLTVLAQLRFIWLRNSRVWEVEEVVPSSTRYHWYSARFDSTHGFVYRLLFGTEIDYKCLAASLVLHFCFVAIIRLCNRLLPSIFKYQLLLVTRTLVPYGAGILWRSGSLVVSWHGTFLRKPATSESRRRIKPTDADDKPPHSLLTFAFPHIEKRAGKLMHRISVRSKQVKSTFPQLLECDMHSIDSRTREIESSIYLMNLGVMTDPLTYLQLRILGGQLIGVYESKLTKRCVMLPLKLTTSVADIPIDWNDLELQFVMNTKELDWWDLLQCG